MNSTDSFANTKPYNISELALGAGSGGNYSSFVLPPSNVCPMCHPFQVRFRASKYCLRCKIYSVLSINAKKASLSS